MDIILNNVKYLALRILDSENDEIARQMQKILHTNEFYYFYSGIEIKNNSICFNNVVPQELYRIENIDGSKIELNLCAIVGENGSGKSTAVSLMERFYLPETGCLRFGDCLVEDIHLNEWRRSIGYVSQDTTLISGTLRENLTYALHRPVEETELQQALKIANLEDFVAALPKGMDADLGELGEKLSGGERQRIAIARIILRNPEYLILDEVTSALDAENKAAVMGALRKLMAGRTCVLISHDMDMVRSADHIVVLDEGSVQAEGNCDQVIKNSAYFAECCSAACQ